MFPCPQMIDVPNSRFKLTFSLLSSRSASAKYRRAPKQNARCWGGHTFGARKQPVWHPSATSAHLQSPPESLRCRVRTHGVVARREPRVRSELLHAKGDEKCGRLMASGPRYARSYCQQRHDDGFVANARESAAVLVEKWIGRNHACQVNEDWSTNRQWNCFHCPI